MMKKILEIKPKKDFYSHSYISLKNSYFFHSVGKAANSTVKHFLYLEELKGSGLKCRTVHDRVCSPLISPYQLNNGMVKDVLEGNFFKFTFVRNPYSRALSCYLDRIKNHRTVPYKKLVKLAGKELGYEFTFNEFIELICNQKPYDQDNHWRLQYADVCAEVISYDFIGKQESFSTDMETVWRKIFREDNIPDFTSENKSPSKTSSETRIEEYWTPSTIKLFNEAYDKDFSFFNYDKR